QPKATPPRAANDPRWRILPGSAGTQSLPAGEEGAELFPVAPWPALVLQSACPSAKGLTPTPSLTPDAFAAGSTMSSRPRPRGNRLAASRSTGDGIYEMVVVLR